MGAGYGSCLRMHAARVVEAGNIRLGWRTSYIFIVFFFVCADVFFRRGIHRGDDWSFFDSDQTINRLHDGSSLQIYCPFIYVDNGS